MPAKNILSYYLKIIISIAIAGFVLWYFTALVAYICVAIFLSLMGMPLVKRLNKIRFGKRPMPHAASATITLFTLLLIFGLFILIIVPLIIRQANVISAIDVDKFVEYYKGPLLSLNHFLIQYNVISSGETIAHFIEEQITDLLNLTQFTNFFANLVSATGSVLMGTFIILFLTFYFLLEENITRNFILVLTPDEHTENIARVLHDSKLLLVRYFQGILLEIIIMMTIESAGLLIFDVPNALLIGFFGGLMNVIPYLGPVIGAILGIILASLSELSMDNYDNLLITIVTVVAVFGAANMVDNFVLQPQIYSRRVKAHPVEVFLVIIVGGKVAGIAGMILAIPIYTVIKVIAREFAQRMKLVKFLTRKM